MREFFPYFLVCIVIIVGFNTVYYYQNKKLATQMDADPLGHALTETASQRARSLQKQQRLLMEDRAQRMRRLQEQQQIHKAQRLP